MHTKNNYLLNKFFSRSVLNNLLKYSQDEVFKNFSRENQNHLDTIRENYQQLSKSYRNEYFYKNTLLNKLLLGVHSINTTTALTEIPVGRAKPDFILINGKAVVYEIKTELDNFERLDNQINEYYRAFNYVAIVTYEKNLENAKKKISEINKPIGLYILQRNSKIKTVIKPEEYNLDIDRDVLFKILRKVEYENIIRKHFGTLPKVSQFDYYGTCKKLTEAIPLEQLYSDFLIELKKRNAIDKILFEEVPYELKFLVYFMNFKTKDYEDLKRFLQK
ncbi:sce7726 family protein [Streptococcus suis]|nr:sce7726 family protein [Streptococcus suis]NQP19539.1 sce7726 family protein [Streptococcus suis]